MKQSPFNKIESRPISFVTMLLVVIITTSVVIPRAQTPTVQTTAQQSKQADVPELKVGEPIERELASGEVHSYRVSLTAGQFLHVVVKQNGIDVMVRLFGEDGTKLSGVDNQDGVHGTESVSGVAKTSGDYRIEVERSQETKPGRYEINIQTIREASAQDLVKAEAERILQEGKEVYKQGTADALRNAVKKFEEALSYWRTLGDVPSQANALAEIGIIYLELSNHAKSRESLTQALSLWRTVENRKQEGAVLSSLGWVHLRSGEAQDGLNHFLQALKLIKISGNRRDEAALLGNVGTAYTHLSEPQKALDYFDQALPIFVALGDRQGEAAVLANSGSLYRGLGEFQAALECYARAVPLIKAVGDKLSEGSLKHSLASLYLELGEFDKALDYHNQALLLRREAGDRRGESYTLEGIGVTYARSGKPETALDFYSRSLALRREVGDRRGEAYSHNNIGVVLDSLGEHQKALESYNQALPIMEAIGDRNGLAQVLYRVGVTYSRSGDQKKALEYQNRALQISREVRNRTVETAAHYWIAYAQRKLGETQQARVEIEAAIELIESTRSKVMNQQLRTFYFASQQNVYDFYVDLLQEAHKSQPSAGYNVVALQVSERARARSLLESLVEARANLRYGADPTLLERERSTRQQLNAKSDRLSRLLSAKHTEEQATAARKEVEALLIVHQDIQTEIRTKSPRYAALTQPQSLSLKEIQQLLDNETLLLEYALGEERSYLWAVSPTSLTSYELPGRAEIEMSARKFYELLTTRKNRELETQLDAAAALSKMLLGPVADKLGEKRLIIVSDGPLQYIPFAALPEPVVKNQRLLVSRKPTNKYQPLVVKHEVVNLPSASVLAVVRRELAGRVAQPKAVAVLADPVFRADDPRLKLQNAKFEKTGSGTAANSLSNNDFKSEVERSAWESGVENLPRLLHSRAEAKAIVEETPGRDVLLALDLDANRETVISGQLEHYRIVHFATHSLLNSVHPELSGVVLSLVDKNGRSQDGFLRLHEVYNLNLPAELVVLSGCRTALGKEVRGEGLVGLTRGFMYAGAPRVVVSLWPVSDQGTAELMKRFYQGMLRKRMRPAAALRDAQIAMWKTRWWDAPYYWGGFVLQGEWR